MAVREQVLSMLNEIKEYVGYLEKEHIIEILNGNKKKNILGLKDILHQIIMEKYHFGSQQIIRMLKRRYDEYTEDIDESNVWEICDDLIEQVNYWYKNKNKSIVYGSSYIKEVHELLNIYYDLL
tara:strand:+ start:57 stop:428 length:372 start_codon:yes stop_codon:yes gene_type:complete